MPRRRIAIIGAGFSGVAVATQLLLSKSRNGCDITLIERGERFGAGLAYRTDDKRSRLNVRASNMSALAQTPDDFVRWLKLDSSHDGTETFALRARYGRYLENVLQRAQRSARGNRLRRIREEALACRAVEDTWCIEFEKRDPLECDAVVLALGNVGADAPPPLAQIAVVSAWDLGALKQIPARADLLLIGTGLTMIDAVLALSVSKEAGMIYALSRRGLVPRQQGPTSRSPPLAVHDIPLPLSEALRVVRREVRAMEARGEPWQWAMERIRAITPALWARLTLEEKQRFLRHLRPWWDVHRHRAPPETNAVMADLVKSGRLRILAGEIASAEATPQGVQIMHRQRGSFGRHRLEVGAVINCTGTAFSVAKSRDPLVQQLAADSYARADATGLGFDVDGDGRLVGSGHNQNLFALGPPTQGAFWESLGVPEIRDQAQVLAQILTSES